MTSNSNPWTISNTAAPHNNNNGKVSSIAVMMAASTTAISSTPSSTGAASKKQRRRFTTTTAAKNKQYQRSPRHRNSYNKQSFQKPRNPKLFRAFDPNNNNNDNGQSTKTSLVDIRNDLLLPIPNNKRLTSILKTWANCARPDGADRCFEVLQHLRQHHDDGNLTANQYTYGVVVNAYARRGQPERCESVLRSMFSSGEHQSGDDGHTSSPRPNVILFNTVLSSWSKSNAWDAPERCMQLLEEMMARNHLRPDVYTCTSIIDAYAKRGRAQEAERFLRSVIQPSSSSTTATPTTPNIPTGIRLNAFAFSSVMNAWCKSDAHDAPDRCMRLLKEMEKRNIRPDTFTYATAIDAFASRGRAEEAEDLLLKEMMGEEQQLSPSVVSFSSVIHAWSKSDAEDAPDRCMRLLTEMQENQHLEPNVITYTNVMSAFAKHNRPEEAERILREMQSRTSSNSVPPNAILLSSVMNAWAKSNARDGPDRCMQLLEEMEHLQLDPDVVSYNIAIDALAKRGRGLDAERILRRMMLKSTTTTKVAPDLITFNSVMAAWSKSNVADGPDRCLRLLEEMKELKIKPHTVTYTTIITSFAKRGRAEEAEDMLRSMMQQKGNNNSKKGGSSSIPRPNEFSFNAVLAAWANANVQDGPERCIRLLKEMKDFLGFDQPPTDTRNTITDVFQKQGRAQEIEAKLANL